MCFLFGVSFRSFTFSQLTGGNICHGSLPSRVDGWTYMWFLETSQLGLQGPIPAPLRRVNLLRLFVAHHNRFEGPPSLALHNLVYCNSSHRVAKALAIYIRQIVIEDSELQRKIGENCPFKKQSKENSRVFSFWSIFLFYTRYSPNIRFLSFLPCRWPRVLQPQGPNRKQFRGVRQVQVSVQHVKSA